MSCKVVRIEHYVCMFKNGGPGGGEMKTTVLEQQWKKNYTLGTCIILITNVTPIHLIKMLKNEKKKKWR